MDTLKNILVVDDEADLVELVSYNMKKEGFQVDSASDGESALTKIRKGKYDLLVRDLMLPGIQGMELCRILRNDPKTPALPIIMLTAKGEEVDRILGLEMGCDDYMAKPFSPRELIARVIHSTVKVPQAAGARSASGRSVICAHHDLFSF